MENSLAWACHFLTGLDEEWGAGLDVLQPGENVYDVMRGFFFSAGFFMCDRAPECHSYIAKTCHPSNPKAFNAAIRREVCMWWKQFFHFLSLASLAALRFRNHNAA